MAVVVVAARRPGWNCAGGCPPLRFTQPVAWNRGAQPASSNVYSGHGEQQVKPESASELNLTTLIDLVGSNKGS